MKKINFEDASKLIDNALISYQYGSRVYGTYSANSDFDFIMIFEDDYAKNLDDQYMYCGQELSSGKKFEENFSIYSVSKFQQMLNDHHISALECIFQNYQFAGIIKKPFEFKLDLAKLRKSISEKSSHSWVKAKKKFEVESDRNIYVGKKSLFHSLRIIEFGIQIATYGKISYYNSCVDLWLCIKDNPSENWKDYEEEYKPLFNRLMSQFRKLAPKGN